jgi:hypothetical protein
MTIMTLKATCHLFLKVVLIRLRLHFSSTNPYNIQERKQNNCTRDGAIPIVPAIQETEAGESLGPRSQSGQHG